MGIYQARQKLKSINAANKRPVNSEELVRYAHRISSTHAVSAPVTWQQGDPRRPYPTGWWGQQGNTMSLYPTGWWGLRGDKIVPNKICGDSRATRPRPIGWWR